MPNDSGATATLLDGTPITIRRLSTADFDAVVRMAGGLSIRERYQRFFTAHPGYLSEWASSMTAPDAEIVAIGAFESGQLIGVANYAEAPQPGSAEVAVVIAHEQHDRGVATLLLKALAALAHGAGLRRFVADVLTENHAMRRVMIDARWPVTIRRDQSTLRIEVDLDSLGDTDLAATSLPGDDDRHAGRVCDRRTHRSQ